MPKSTETEDSPELKSTRLKICLSSYNKLYRANPMKRSARPLFSLLLLTFFAATFVSRTFFHHRTIATMTSVELEAPILTTPIQSPAVFNETLLRLASVDLSEEKTEMEVNQLLDGDMDSVGKYRAFNTWRKLNNRDIRSKQRAPPLTLNFHRNWITFRRALRDWWRNRRHGPEVISELVGLVRGSIDGSGSKYSSCAVIGNSGILLNSDHGDMIDGHEAVIRLNNARTRGHEKDVGSKTTISFINSNILHLCARKEGCFCHPYGVETPTVTYICQALHFLDYSACNATWRSRLVVTDPRFDVLCSRLVKYYSLKRYFSSGGDNSSIERWGSEHGGSFFHYSSGMQAVMMALGVCERVGLFGFGKSGSAKHHYHTNQKAELRLHDYEAEYDLYRNLAERPEAVPFIPRSFEIPPINVYR